MTQHQSVSHELGYFNNSAFDGVETREAEIANQMVRIYENDVEKEDRHQKKKVGKVTCLYPG